MNGWLLILLPAFSAWIALLEMDAVLVGQWLLSRPILAGPLVGALAGELQAGLVMGVLTELFCLERKPVGSVLPISGAVAAGCAVLLTAGRIPVPAAAAFPAGLGLGLGHSWCEGRLRQWRKSLTEEAVRALELHGEVDWEWIHMKSLGAHAGMTALFVYAAVAAAAPVLLWLWTAVPWSVRHGMEAAFRAAPWIGLAAAAFIFLRKR